MTYFSTIYKLSLVAAFCFTQGNLERFGNVLIQRSVFKYFYKYVRSLKPIFKCSFSSPLNQDYPFSFLMVFLLNRNHSSHPAICPFLTMFDTCLNEICLPCSADGNRCPVLECWFVQEKAGRGGGLTPAVNQEKSLLLISTSAHSGSQPAPSDINPDKIYFVTGEFRGTP